MNEQICKNSSKYKTRFLMEKWLNKFSPPYGEIETVWSETIIVNVLPFFKTSRRESVDMVASGERKKRN